MAIEKLLKKQIVLAIRLSLIGMLGTAQAADWHVSITGTPSGNGSINNPWDLQTAFNHPASVQPGDNILIHRGLYVGRYISKLKGTVNAPIKVRPYENDEVILDGNVPMPDVKLNTLMPAAAPGGFSCVVSDGTKIRNGRTMRIDDEVFNVNKVVGNIVSGWRESGYCPEGTCPPHEAGSQVFVQAPEDTLQVPEQSTDVWFMNFEVRNSNPLRSTSFTGSHPWDMDRGGITVHGPRTKFINLIVNNNSGGYGFWRPAQDAEIYGSIIYNNGWSAADRGHGHGIYTQNKEGLKTIRDSILLGNFGLGMQVYGSDAAFTDNYLFEGNAFISDRFLFGGYNPASNLTLSNNFIFKTTMEISYNNEWSDVNIINNYLGGAVFFKKSRDVVVTGNTFFNPNYATGGLAISITPNHSQQSIPGDYSFSNNTYFNMRGNRGVAFALSGGYCFNPAVDQLNCDYHKKFWQAGLGYDTVGSNYTLGSVPPDRVFIRRNAYDSSRAHVFIYNWSNSTTVNVVDTTGLLQNGDQYELRSALDIYGDVITGTYSGSIAVNMMNRKPPVKPIGWANDLTINTFPQFGAFILKNLRTGGALVGSVGANEAPIVEAGDNRTVSLNTAVPLNGEISDDGGNTPQLKAFWIKQTGPGGVFFSDYKSPNSQVTFTQDGVYILRLVGTDGQLGSEDFVTITAGKGNPPAPPATPTNGNIEFRFDPVINPSAGRATMEIPFNLITADSVSMRIYDRNGGLVKVLFDGSLSAGPQKVIWDGKNSDGENSSSGIYVLKIKVGGNSDTRTLAVVR